MRPPPMAKRIPHTATTTMPRTTAIGAPSARRTSRSTRPGRDQVISGVMAPRPPGRVERDVRPPLLQWLPLRLLDRAAGPEPLPPRLDRPLALLPCGLTV